MSGGAGCVNSQGATPAESAVHRTIVGSTLGVALELGDRLVDSAGVAADRAVDETGRVVEIVGAGQQIRVLPDRVAGVDTDRLGQPLPQCRGLPQLAWSQFEADQRGEGLLGRTAGGPAAAQRLTERGRARG